MKCDLVSEGGGAKGFVFVGALEEFYRRNHTAGRLMGTSAGAITAVLIAAVYTRRKTGIRFSRVRAKAAPPPPRAQAAADRIATRILRSPNSVRVTNTCRGEVTS